MSIKVNNGIAHRGIKHINLVVCNYNDQQLVFKFGGVTVPGAVTVLKENYSKNGKWSYTEWEVEPCEGATILTISQDWETGKWLNSLEWKSAIIK